MLLGEEKKHSPCRSPHTVGSMQFFSSTTLSTKPTMNIATQYGIPGTAISMLHRLTHLIITKPLWDRNSCYPATPATWQMKRRIQRGWTTRLRPQSNEMAEVGFEPKESNSRSYNPDHCDTDRIFPCFLHGILPNSALKPSSWDVLGVSFLLFLSLSFFHLIRLI